MDSGLNTKSYCISKIEELIFFSYHHTIGTKGNPSINPIKPRSSESCTRKGWDRHPDISDRICSWSSGEYS